MNQQAQSQPAIQSWHAHVYYDESCVEQATTLCERAKALLPVDMGRIHRKPVGPHPMWSCQLKFANECFSDVVIWLNMQRRGLTIFVHPNTGSDLPDHRDRAIWLGDSAKLKLSVFTDRNQDKE